MDAMLSPINMTLRLLLYIHDAHRFYYDVFVQSGTCLAVHDLIDHCD